MISARSAAAAVLVCACAGLARAQEGAPQPDAQPDAPPVRKAEPPKSPEAPYCLATGKDVTLSWPPVKGAASYALERAPEEGEFAPLASTGPEALDKDSGNLRFVDRGLAPGAVYRYRVSARDAAGQSSAPSGEGQARVLKAPVGLTVAPDEKYPERLRVSFTDEDPEHVLKFVLERRTLVEAAGAPWVVADPPRAGAARVIDDKKKSRKDKSSKKTDFYIRDREVDPQVLYEYRVVALGEEGSAPSEVVRNAATAPPTAPQGLVAGAFTVDRISLRWRGTSLEVEGYRVERRAIGGKEWAALGAALSPRATAAVDEVAPGAAFEYRVVALNAKGEAASEPVRARTPTRGPRAIGNTGASRVHQGPTAVPDTEAARPQRLRDRFSPLPDRWRISFPEWNRYPEKLVDPEEAPYQGEGSALNPYTQNVLKGDYPILGNDIFFEMELQSDTLVEGRSFPLPGGVSTSRSRGDGFFGRRFDQLFVNQSFVLSAELFQGDTAFRPKDAAVKATVVGNINYLQAYEKNLVNIDVREGEDRLDGHLGIQELLFDKHLVDLGPNYDFVTFVGGVQRFQSDFRGFLYADNNLGARLQTNYLSNRLQLNLAYFHQLEKETNSGLNRYQFRDQDVFIANLYFQDCFKELGSALFGHDVLGYALTLSYHFNRDDGGRHFDSNDFLVRPRKIGRQSGIGAGSLRNDRLRVHYLGFGGEGHIGPVNLMHQYYLAVGNTTFDEVAGKGQDVLAHFFALEASIDVDWLRFKASYMYASGDRNPTNGTAAGFSAILDNPFFAGAGFSYFNRQNIPLVQTGVQLTNRLSLLPDMRSSKLEGQSNFVNPGLHLFNLGVSAKVTPKLFVDLNVNLLTFDDTQVLQYVLVQDHISRNIGVDYNVGIQYRPFLTENVIVTGGCGVLVPGAGFRQVYSSKTLYSGFIALTLTY
ncbi:MAG: fibronectin type III domain-containing protein [Planctomycetota bacterium]